MKKVALSILLFLIAGFLASGFSSAALPKKVQSQLHKDITILVISQNNVSDLDKLIKDPQKYKILVVQLRSTQCTQEQKDLITKWVQDGGTVWFYDSRLADWFGMENAPVEATKFDCKSAQGEYSDDKAAEGAIAKSFPASSHPVLTGVNQVMVFLLKVDVVSFSAVKISEDVTPLLKVNNENKAVAAIKPFGKGIVVFKPLLQQQDGEWDRFQENLKEFSAGYSVPPLAPEEAQAGPTSNADCVYMRDGSLIKGEITQESFDVYPDEEKYPLSLIPADIREIDLSQGDEYVTVTLKNGKTIRGILMDLKIDMYVNFKKKEKLGKFDILKIVFAENRDFYKKKK